LSWEWWWLVVGGWWSLVGSVVAVREVATRKKKNTKMLMLDEKKNRKPTPETTQHSLSMSQNGFFFAAQHPRSRKQEREATGMGNEVETNKRGNESRNKKTSHTHNLFYFPFALRS
jgi:hypothetical protein